jgi:hypothetical protein
MEGLPEVFLGSLQRAPWGWALLATVVLALIKVWPIIHLQTLNARAVLRGEKRSDLSDCRQQIADMRSMLDATIKQMHDIELKLVRTADAFRVAEMELNEIDPGNGALAQARTIFREAWDVTTFGAIPHDMGALIHAAHRHA